MEYKNAITFIDALIGWEDVADQQSKPKSPHARTHLEAILGNGSLNIQTYNNTPRKGVEGERLKDLADYLIKVGVTLNNEIAKVST